MSDPASPDTPDTFDDLLGRIDACARQTLEWTEAMGDLARPLVESMASLVASMLGVDLDDRADRVEPNPTSWSTTVKVFRDVRNRPLELATTGFRLVGAGPGIVIGPTSVSFVPPILHSGQDTFTVTVQMGTHSNGIYEGIVTAKDDPTLPVTDCVMPAW